MRWVPGEVERLGWVLNRVMRLGLVDRGDAELRLVRDGGEGSVLRLVLRTV